jgi:hypothetical protein
VIGLLSNFRNFGGVFKKLELKLELKLLEAFSGSKSLVSLLNQTTEKETKVKQYLSSFRNNSVPSTPQFSQAISFLLAAELEFTPFLFSLLRTRYKN